MRTNLPKVGTRVKLKALERYPDFILEGNETGTVVLSQDDKIAVKLDKQFAFLDEWDNEVHFHEDLAFGSFSDLQTTQEKVAALFWDEVMEEL